MYPEQYTGLNTHFDLPRFAALIVARLDRNGLPGLQKSEFKRFPGIIIAVATKLLADFELMRTGRTELSTAEEDAKIAAAVSSTAGFNKPVSALFTAALRKQITKEITSLPELLWGRLDWKGDQLIGFKNIDIAIHDFCKPNLKLGLYVSRAVLDFRRCVL